MKRKGSGWKGRGGHLGQIGSSVVQRPKLYALSPAPEMGKTNLRLNPLWLGVWSLGFGVWGLEFGVGGLGFGVRG